ncbi:MAG TPA: DNA polymerase III subunit alpha [Candidatus Nesterenkonia stercoripullorum]|uniref:DNA polymerase III subunit alpha n=1 Tax=Candidatus Nesterenkonia stercoripullorum TaxID=2838701 RepID=A0A9D2A9G3_9MICC|nr:DNA polymerase III subunit alpha [Candidatus Nesterenkonia stercoripullorum]
MSPFVHLHVASCYSSHFGTSTPDALVAQAAADGAFAAAVTDRDGLYGAAKHVAACVRYGLAPILGANIAVADRGRVVVLAHGSAAGYRALNRAVSAAHHAPETAISLADLAALARPAPETGDPSTVQSSTAQSSPVQPGPKLEEVSEALSPRLFVLVGPESDVGQAAAQRQYLTSAQLLAQWKDALPARGVYGEAVSHLTPPGESYSTAHAVRMLRTAAKAGVPSVLTNAVRLLGTDDAATADVLDAVRLLEDLQSVPTLQPNAQGWLKPPADMAMIAEEICEDLPEGSLTASALLHTTVELAGQCALDPARHIGWRTPKVPEASVIGIAGDPMEELRQRCHRGLGERLDREDVRARLNHELQVIEQLGFASYFLTVAEVMRLIRELGVRAAARGSGVSSLVVHALGISPIDPLAHGLIFERFLSQRRSTLPDIDIDVESARRLEIYHAVFARFGADRVTLMSMQNSYRIRGAVRDAGLALGLPEEEIDALAEMMWRFPAAEFREALEEKPELRRLAERVETEQVTGGQQLNLLVDLTERLDRLPRHISTHPCGVILGDASLRELTPVQASGVSGLPMSQYDKDDMDPMGFLKLDILGVRMQSAIAYALQQIRLTAGETIDLDAIDYSDRATFEMIQSTHTLGCFQIESPGQRELIGKLVPQSLDDLIVDISLFRPGPMGSGMVRPYLERRHGFEAASYPHPDLAEILGETHGVVVYHEQVLRIIHTMTGYGLDQADEMRRALGSSAQEETEQRFRAAAVGRGYSQTVIEAVWEILAHFGSFGFCKAHGAAFAVPTYQSSWLKTHYPVAFLAGLFEHDPGMYPLRLLVAEARRLGVVLLPMDINSSTGHYYVERIFASGAREGKGQHDQEQHPEQQWGIRMALSSLKGISQNEVHRIEREQPFVSIDDALNRARLKNSTVRDLIRVGAFDALSGGGPEDRAALLARCERSQPRPARAARHQAYRQQALPLAELPTSGTRAQVSPQETAPLSTAQIVATELELTSIDVTGHVMENHRDALAACDVTYAERLLDLRNGEWVRVAGIRVATQTPPMASGKRVVFITLDDGTGCVDLSFFDEAQSSSSEALFTAQLLMAEGRIRRTGPRAVTVQAERAWDLRDMGPTGSPG